MHNRNRTDVPRAEPRSARPSAVSTEAPAAPPLAPAAARRHHLQYGPAVAWFHRKTVRDYGRRAIKLLIIAAAAFALFQIFQRGVLLHQQRQCLSYALPPDKIVFESSPAPARQLLRADAQYFALHGGSAAWFPRCWDRFAAAASPPGERPAAVLFLHQRAAPDGAMRLVIVQLRQSTTPPFLPIIDAEICRPGGWFVAPAILAGPGHLRVRGDYFWSDSSAHVQFLAGQCDAADASHFIIPFRCDNRLYRIDGWLVSGDQVELDWENTPQK